MIYLAVYSAIGVTSMVWFVIECGEDLKRYEVGLVLLIGVIWPIAALSLVWEFFEDIGKRIRASDECSRWHEWWKQPMRKRSTERTIPSR